VSVRAVRKDGYDGDIDIELVDAPAGFELSGARIPAGRDRVRMTITSPRRGAKEPLSLKLVGRIEDGRDVIERPVVPADNVMQAFLWRHIVPAQELAVFVVGRGGRWVPEVELAHTKPVRVPKGGKAVVRFDVNGRVPVSQVKFGLWEAPKGITLGEAKSAGRGFELEIKADRETERTKFADNLIVEIFAEREVPDRRRGQKGKPKMVKRRVSMGFLPAIPYRVIYR
jgi:hypothetical protein